MSKVIVRLVKKTSNGIPTLQVGAKKTIRILHKESGGGFSLSLNEEQRKYFFSELVRGWNGDKSAKDKELEYEFLRDFSIKLSVDDYEIDKTTVRGQFEHLVLANHKEIALDSSDLKKKPWAKFQLIDEHKEATLQNKIYSDRRRAYEVIDSLISREQQIEFLKLFNEDAEGLHPDIVQNKLYEKAQTVPKVVLSYAKDENDTRYERSLIFDGIKYEILIEDMDNGIDYGTKFLGNNREEAVKFLKNIKNQRTKKSLIEAIKAAQAQSTKKDFYAEKPANADTAEGDEFDDEDELLDEENVWEQVGDLGESSLVSASIANAPKPETNKESKVADNKSKTASTVSASKK